MNQREQHLKKEQDKRDNKNNTRGKYEQYYPRGFMADIDKARTER